MNYFGHAAVASWRREPPGFVLGAMLPDFSSMCGARLAPGGDAAIEAGIALHHATDAAFHALAPVTASMRELDGRLEHGGCAKGPRRAVAHIGVELLIDGVLVADEAYRAAYSAALDVDPAGIAWRNPGDRDRFAQLFARLRGHGPPDDLRRVDSIVMRLSRVLAHRPLLAPNAADLRAIHAALVDHQPRVTVAAETVMRGMRAALSAR